ncbi:50S ribosomal protein L17 [candidate division WOR-1 bacterium RIFOXYC2_FULL_37_10]|uniref:50S ribosomal protein L17 n=1 Tax=candidate division WOR-1 bacterium RIFOXYB2_FULL_37_13 TaxID=1802579 RepID=A0A1F4SRY5_UNCSA|nr:MAG: 50S ribosomal protein L17 [candidate division WOR-1 bacterium RIFOXYA2_FULL_37_7]OGC23200.1 MAG: 50S ribosomal protein L17 [candidate division WOR-1 bacterium RIFOXYB2_FULL_37_13]OGC37029.1 MAG: 50S ribosomal protein L17 [candidate division WOR-1 bacterium RIFOXYC2_FULL_37_10]
MRHKRKLKKLGRPTDQRLALLRDGVLALIKYGKIKTTVTRAKEIRKMAEKLLTLGKKGTVASRREAYKKLGDRDSVGKLFEIASRFAERNGGFTRQTKIGVRRGDAVAIASIEFVD